MVLPKMMSFHPYSLGVGAPVVFIMLELQKFRDTQARSLPSFLLFSPLKTTGSSYGWLSYLGPQNARTSRSEAETESNTGG